LLLREFVRQFVFAHLRMVQAFAVDLTATAIFLGGLGVWAVRGHLSASAAWLALGASCAIPACVWLFIAREQFAWRPEALPDTWRRHWSFGRWILGALVAQSLVIVAIQTLQTLAHDTTANGLFAACLTVVVVSNPLLIGASNYLCPRCARAMADGGPAEVQRVVAAGTWLVGIAMCGFFVLVVSLGEPAIRRLYGAAFGGQRWTVTALALGVFVSSLGLAATQGLAAMERADAIFRARLLGLTTAVGVTAVLVVPLPVFGGALGYLGGAVVDVVAIYIGYRRMVTPADRMTAPGESGGKVAG
jgi:O-antigen/teichoic acid export membrane protein